MNKIIKGDMVIVIAGNDKGKTGEVVSISNGRVLIDGINEKKKHVRPDPNKDIKGGIVTLSKPIDLSNVMLFDMQTKVRTRVKIATKSDGKKVRLSTKTGQEII